MKRILLAAASAIVFTSVAYARDSENAYLWVHPKLGPILVDKATNAPLRSACAVIPDSAAKVGRQADPR